MKNTVKILRKTACLLLALTAVLSAVPPGAAAPLVTTTAGGSTFYGLSPYKDIVDSASLGALTAKSMIYNKPLTDIQKIIQSDRYLRVPGPLHAERAGLTGVTYTYSDKVRVLEPDTLAALGDEDEANDQPALNLMRDRFLERNEEIASGAILVDEKAQQVLRVTASPDAAPGTYLYDAPALHEIFDSFEIPEQTVHLKEGNITRTAVPYKIVPASVSMVNSMREKGIRPLVPAAPQIPNYVPYVPDNPAAGGGRVRTGSSGYLDGIHMQPLAPAAPSGKAGLDSLAGPMSDSEKMLEFTFDTGSTLTGMTPSGGVVSARVGGSLAIGGISCQAKYTGFNGYKFGLSISEGVNCKVTLTARVNEDVYIPIVGLDIPFGIGSVTAGVFLVVSINGDLTVFVELNQGLTVEAGMWGPTFFYIPCGFLPYITSDFFVKFGADFLGQVNGGIGLGPVLCVTLLGEDLVGAELRLGAGIGCVSDGEYMDIDLDGILYASFTIVGKKFDLLNKRWDILEKRKKDEGVYRFSIYDRCAYRDYVTGNVKQGTADITAETPDATLIPYVGPVKVRVTSGGVLKKELTVNTDGEGNFKADFRNIFDLKAEHRISVELEGKTSESFETTFPFEATGIHAEADFFEDYIKASVDPIEIGRDANDRPILASYTGDAVLRIQEPSGSFRTEEIRFENGEYSASYNFKPYQTVRIILVSDNFLRISPEFAAAADITYEVTLTKRTDAIFPSSEWEQGIMNLNNSDQKTALSTHDYVFAQVTVQNNNGPKTITDVDLEIGLATPSDAPAKDEEALRRKLINPLGEFCQPTVKTYEPQMRIEQPGLTRGLAFYIYRFVNSEAPQEDGGEDGFPLYGGDNDYPQYGGGGDDMPSLEYRPRLEAYLQENFRPLDFKKAVWRGMPEDYLNYGARPTSINGEEYAYIGARISFQIDGYTFTDSDLIFMNFGSLGPMKAVIPKPPLVSGDNMDWGENTLITPGSLMAFEEYVAELRNRDRLTLPQLEGLRWSADVLGARLSGKEYVSGTISNEQDIASWASDAVRRTVGWEIIDLTEKGEFDGRRLITRDEFTAYVSRAFGLMTTGRGLNFSDVPLSNSYRSEIMAAYENGIIGGMGDNKFAPGALLTREQASTIIYRAMVAVLGEDTVKKAAVGNAAFKDAGLVSGYARQAVQDMANAGILTGMGDGSFQPGASISVEQTAVILDRIIRTFIL